MSAVTSSVPAKRARYSRESLPHPVRQSLLEYFRHRFSLRQDWKHPFTNEVYEHRRVREVLERYKHLNPENYRALWMLWTTQAPRSYIAEAFYVSGSTLRRRWDDAIDVLLFMLLFPELQPDVVVKLYEAV